jgi:hypothetical protein
VKCLQSPAHSKYSEISDDPVGESGGSHQDLSLQFFMGVLI